MLRHTVSWRLVHRQMLGLAVALPTSVLGLMTETVAFQVGSPSPVAASARNGSEVPEGGPVRSQSAVDLLLDAIADPRVRDFATEALQLNPEIARAERLITAAAARVPQARSLPDPTAAVSLFALPPETRAGPQRLSASVQQTLPWFGKRDLAERAAAYDVVVRQAQLETAKIDVVTEVRRLAVELAFLDAYEAIVDSERSTLERYESIAQGRYATGSGLQQGVVRIQAEITRVDVRRLEIAERRSALMAQLNRVRSRPAIAPIGLDLDLASWSGGAVDAEQWFEWAQPARTELVALQARIDAAEVAVELAQKQYRPDIGLGLAYTMVDRRRDSVGRTLPPEDDGDDVLAFTGSIKLPVRTRRLDAAVEEAQAMRWAREEEKRAMLVRIESTIGDIASRLPLLRKHLNLLEEVLIKQARESLRSAEGAYRTGRLNAVDLLDAEVVLLEVQIAAARTRADLAGAWIEAERAVGRPLNEPLRGPR